MTEESFEVVFHASTKMDADIVQAMLEEAGIQVIVLPKGEVWKRWYLGPSQESYAQLLVPAEDAERSRALLAEYQQQVEAGAFQLSDEEEPE